MSGPIVRKYGFPNFEKIFGERPLAAWSRRAGPIGRPFRQYRPRQTQEKGRGQAQKLKAEKSVADVPRSQEGFRR